MKINHTLGLLVFQSTVTLIFAALAVICAIDGVESLSDTVHPFAARVSFTLAALCVTLAFAIGGVAYFTLDDYKHNI